MPNETLQTYKRTFLQICERSLYYEYDRQSQIQTRVNGLTTLATLLCAAAWYFSSFEYGYRSPGIFYIGVLTSAWCCLLFCIYFAAYAAMFRSQSALADMHHWQQWLQAVEHHYDGNGVNIENEILDKLSAAMSATQIRYAGSNERRYKSLQKAQICIIAALLCIAVLACVKSYLDYNVNHSSEQEYSAVK